MKTLIQMKHVGGELVAAVAFLLVGTLGFFPALILSVRWRRRGVLAQPRAAPAQHDTATGPECESVTPLRG